MGEGAALAFTWGERGHLIGGGHLYHGTLIDDAAAIHRTG
jgi:hypothetical protein